MFFIAKLIEILIASVKNKILVLHFYHTPLQQQENISESNTSLRPSESNTSSNPYRKRRQIRSRAKKNRTRKNDEEEADVEASKERGGTTATPAS